MNRRFFLKRLGILTACVPFIGLAEKLLKESRYGKTLAWKPTIDIHSACQCKACEDIWGKKVGIGELNYQ